MADAPRFGVGRGSLRLRLLTGTALWVAAALLVAGFVLTGLFREHAVTQFQAALRVHLDQLTARVEAGVDGQPVLPVALTDPRMSRPLSGLYWQVDTDRRVAQLRSRSLWDGVLALPASAADDGLVRFHHSTGPAGEAVLVAERTVRPAEQPQQRWRMVVAADLTEQAAAVRRFAGELALSLAVLAAGLLVAMVVQVRVGLSPLRRLQVAVNDLRDGRRQRLQGRFPAEVQPLVDDFNAVLDHDAGLIERARTQAGDLAHVLRTPLAVLANAAAAQTGSADPAEFARLVRDQVAQASQAVDWHLSQARLAATAGLPGVRTPVLPVLQALARVMLKLHAGRALVINCDAVSERACFAGESQDLHEMAGNLIDNACKWAVGRVTVSARADGRELVICVDDDGPGLDAGQRSRVVQRGVRIDERMPGSGLGLAIVADLACRHGGSLALEQAASGGLRARLVLPGCR